MTYKARRNTNEHNPEISVRMAQASDLPAISRLARLDSKRLPEGPYLVAAVDGEIRAALSLPGGETVADPFHRTAGLVEMMRVSDMPAAHVAPSQAARRLVLRIT